MLLAYRPLEKEIEAEIRSDPTALTLEPDDDTGRCLRTSRADADGRRANHYFLCYKTFGKLEAVDEASWQPNNRF
jgi:hypothetical protein